MRSNLVPKTALQLAIFQQDFNSELAYNADAGQDSASAPSRRQGIEVSGQYHPLPWFELNSDLAWSKARYQGDLRSFGLDGPYIANAPRFIGSLGILVDKLWRWFGGLQWRELAAYPLSDGDAQPADRGYSEFNADVGYKVNAHLKLQLSVFNLLNSHANSSAYYYTARIPGEAPDGVTGRQVHPLEPIAGTLRATAYF